MVCVCYVFMRFVFYNTCTILIRIHGLIDFRLFSSSPISFFKGYTFNYFRIPKEQTTVTVKNRVYTVRIRSDINISRFRATFYHFDIAKLKVCFFKFFFDFFDFLRLIR